MPFEIIKKHKTAVILSIILGFVMVLPFFYFRAELGSNFHGVLPTVVNDVMFYYARINDAADGHSFLSNAYLYEHKDSLPQQLFLAEWLLAQPVKIFNLNINTVHLIYNFLLPAIAFILTYLALFLILKSRFWSIIFSVFLFFGLYLLAFIRPISPQFNFIFWLTQFIFLWLLISKRGSTQIMADKSGNTELLYEDITYKIRGACFKVWKEFRGGFNEKLIEKALVAELKNAGLEVENQKREDIFYNNQKIGTHIFDIIVNKAVLIELKNLPFLTNGSKRQFWTYLKKSPYKLGLLINFGNKLQIERKIFDQARMETQQTQIDADKPQIDTEIQRLSAKNPRLSAILLLNILNFGLLFYIYPYYWTFYLIFFGILIVIYFWENKELALKTAVITIGGLILAIPYFYLNYLSAQLPYYTETLTRLGMIYTRFPSGIRIVFYTIFGLALFGLALWKKIIKSDAKTLFFISGILASVIAVNQHLITGKNFEFSSHYDMGAIFFLVFAAAYLWSKRGSTRIQAPINADSFPRISASCQHLSAILLLIIVLAVVASGLYGYSKRAFAVDENTAYQQNYAPIFEWLNKNTEKDSVVYANVDLSGLIPVYTANNVFYIREANLFFISDREVLDRFILNNYFEKFDENFIVKNDRAIYGVRYIDAYGHAVQGNKLRRLLGIKPEPEIYLPEEAVEKVITRAKELQKGGFIEGLKKFRVDYLVWDKNKNPNWRINSKNFNPVFQNGGLIIFKFVFLNS